MQGSENNTCLYESAYCTVLFQSPIRLCYDIEISKNDQGLLHSVMEDILDQNNLKNTSFDILNNFL